MIESNENTVMPTDSPRLVVIIPTHGRPDLLERTLDSLAECAIPPSLKCIRVVENGGKHGAEECVRKYAGKFDVEYLFYPRGNKSAALNHAMEDLDDELVVYFDDDVRIAPGTLNAYHECLGGIREKTFFGGPFACDYDVPPPDWLLDFLPVSARGWVSHDGRAFGRDSTFFGCNWAAFADDIRALGGFDARVGPGGDIGATGQETDMQVRLRAAGFQPQYVAGAMVWHYVPESRCSPEWAIGRIHRQSVYSGFNSPPFARSLLGVPPWILRRLLQRTGVLLKTYISRDPELRFKARFSLTETLGEIRGMMQRRQSSGRSPAANRG